MYKRHAVPLRVGSKDGAVRSLLNFPVDGRHVKFNHVITAGMDVGVLVKVAWLGQGFLPAAACKWAHGQHKVGHRFMPEQAWIPWQGLPALLGVAKSLAAASEKTCSDLSGRQGGSA